MNLDEQLKICERYEASGQLPFAYESILETREARQAFEKASRENYHVLLKRLQQAREAVSILRGARSMFEDYSGAKELLRALDLPEHA